MIIKKINTMFHKHSRWLFGAFTIVIIVSFMGFLTPGQFGLDMFSDPANTRVGTAFGEPVTYGELITEAERLQLFNQIFYGVSSRGLNPEQAFGPYCMVLAAKRMGLAASDREVAALLRQAPTLQVDGKFSLDAYKQLLANLNRQGIADTDLNDAVRDIVLLNKVGRDLASGVVVTPGEVENFYRQLNGKFKVRAALFDAAAFKSKVDARDAKAIRTYFDTNRSEYQIQAKLSALLLEFPYASFRAEAEKAATAAELEKFFRADPQAFAGKDGKAPEYAKVKNEVRKKFVEARSRDLAVRRAYDFASQAYEAVAEADNKAEAFRKLAAKEKLAIVETGMVDIDAEVVGKIRSPQLMQQLAATAGSNPVTNAIPTENAAYVGIVTERVAARPAEFNEVSRQLATDFVEAQAKKLAREAAESALAAVNAGKDPAARSKAFAALKGCTFKTFEFSLQNPPEAGLEVAAQAVAELRAGEFSSVYNTADGAGISELLKRIPADMKEFAAKKEQYELMCRSYKEQLARQAFEEELSAQCQLLPEYRQR